MLKDLLNEQAQKVVKAHTVKPEKMDNMIEVDSDHEHYPSIHLDSKTLPEIKDWEVDEEYCIMLTVKQRSKSMHSRGKEEVYDGSFDIKELMVMPKPEKKTKKKEMKEEKEEHNSMKEMYGV